MKLWILSHLKESPGNRLMLEAAQGRGHEAWLVDPGRASLVLSASAAPALPRGDGWPEQRPDVVFTRMGSSTPVEAFHLLEYLELLGIPCVNSSESLRRTRDKTTQGLALVRAGLPVPATVLVGQAHDLDAAVETVIGPPWIVKLPVSTQGAGVVLAESRRSLRSVVESLHGVGHRVLVQAFVFLLFWFFQFGWVFVFYGFGIFFHFLFRHLFSGSFRKLLHVPQLGRTYVIHLIYFFCFIFDLDSQLD